MGIQDTVKKQEAKLAAKAEGQQKQPSMQSPPPAQSVIDMQTLRQMIENVVRAELQGIRIEQPQPLDMQVVQQAVRSVIRAELQAMRDEQPRPQQAVVDMQAVHHAVQSGVRAELQSIQTTLTILTQAVQAQTDALMHDDHQDEEQEQDEIDPLTLDTDDQEDSEQQNVFPPDEEEGYPAYPPRPESPTHRLRRPGPLGILLGWSDSPSPITGTRRWEPPV